MVENNIKSEDKLFAIADKQKKTGKKDLANFVLSRSTKAISDLLEKNVFYSKQTCMEVIHEHSRKRCEDSCVVANG